MEEKWKLSGLRFFYGVLLVRICEVLEIENTEENREEVKAMFKRHFHVESLALLTAKELRVFISRIVMFFSREMGIELPEPGDPLENTQDTTLQEWFKLLYEYGKKE